MTTEKIYLTLSEEEKETLINWYESSCDSFESVDYETFIHAVIESLR